MLLQSLLCLMLAIFVCFVVVVHFVLACLRFPLFLVLQHGAVDLTVNVIYFNSALIIPPYLKQGNQNNDARC